LELNSELKTVKEILNEQNQTVCSNKRKRRFAATGTSASRILFFTEMGLFPQKAVVNSKQACYCYKPLSKLLVSSKEFGGTFRIGKCEGIAL
jgi:hypothetical protein